MEFVKRIDSLTHDEQPRSGKPRGELKEEWAIIPNSKREANDKKYKESCIQYEGNKIYLGPSLIVKSIFEYKELSIPFFIKKLSDYEKSELGSGRSKRHIDNFFSPKGCSMRNFRSNFIDKIETEIINYFASLPNPSNLEKGFLTHKYNNPDEVKEYIKGKEQSSKEDTTSKIARTILSPETSYREIIIIDYMRQNSTRPLEPVKQLIMKENNNLVIYLDGMSQGAYGTVVQSLYNGLGIKGIEPENNNSDGALISKRFDAIVDYLRKNLDESKVVILLDNFDFFSSKRTVTSTIYRDNETHSLIDEILSIDSSEVSVVYSLCPNIDFDDIADEKIKEWFFFTDDEEVNIIRTKKPSSKDFIRVFNQSKDRNRFSDEVEIFYKEYCTYESYVSSSCLFSLVSAFQFFYWYLNTPLESKRVLVNRNKESFYRTAASAISKNDLYASCRLMLEYISSDLFDDLALVIIALQDDGCAEEDLNKYLEYLFECGCWGEELPQKDWNEEKKEKVSKLILGDYSPLISSIYRNEKKVLYIHEPIRKALISLWQDDKGKIVLVRNIIFQMALSSYERYKSESSQPRVNKVESSEFAINFYVRLMASVNIEIDKEHDLIETKKLLNDRSRYGKLLEDFEKGSESLSELQKYMLAISFLFNQGIYKNNEDSKLYAADELRLNLLMRAWIPGYYAAKGISLDRGEFRSLPIRLPIALLYRNKVESLQRKLFNSISELNLSNKNRKSDNDLSDVERNQSDLAKAQYLEKELYRLEEYIGEKITHAAARVDDTAMFQSGINIQSNACFGLNKGGELYRIDSLESLDIKLKYMHRHGLVADGKAAALEQINIRKNEFFNVLAIGDKKNRNSVVQGYREYLNKYLKSAARYVDFLTLTNDYGLCFEWFLGFLRQDYLKPFDMFSVDKEEYEYFDIDNIEILLEDDKHNSIMAVKNEVCSSVKEFCSQKDEKLLIYSRLMAKTWSNSAKSPISSENVQEAIKELTLKVSGESTKTQINKSISYRINSWNSEKFFPGGVYWEPCSTYSFSRFVARTIRMRMAHRNLDQNRFGLGGIDFAFDKYIIQARHVKHIGDLKNHVLYSLIEEHIKLLSHNISDTNRIMRSDFSANSLLELAMWIRIGALAPSFTSINSKDGKWKKDWDFFIKMAKSTKRRGNISILTYLRLQLEEVRCFWQLYCLEEPDQSLVKHSLKMLDQIIAISLERKLVSYEIAGRLLKAEINLCSGSRKEKNLENRACEELDKDHVKLNKAREELDKVFSAMERSGCSHRRWEADIFQEALKKDDLNAKPSLYLGA